MPWGACVGGVPSGGLAHPASRECWFTPACPRLSRRFAGHLASPRLISESGGRFPRCGPTSYEIGLRVTLGSHEADERRTPAQAGWRGPSLPRALPRFSRRARSRLASCPIGWPGITGSWYHPSGAALPHGASVRLGGSGASLLSPPGSTARCWRSLPAGALLLSPLRATGRYQGCRRTLTARHPWGDVSASTHRIGPGAGHSGPPRVRVGVSKGTRLVSPGPSPLRTVRARLLALWRTLEEWRSAHRTPWEWP